MVLLFKWEGLRFAWRACVLHFLFVVLFQQCAY